jgi:hypothetical protein
LQQSSNVFAGKFYRFGPDSIGVFSYSLFDLWSHEVLGAPEVSATEQPPRVKGRDAVEIANKMTLGVHTLVVNNRTAIRLIDQGALTVADFLRAVEGTDDGGDYIRIRDFELVGVPCVLVIRPLTQMPESYRLLRTPIPLPR